MIRKVFFSFHYEKDSWRVNPVRNSNVTKDNNAGYVDAVDWEKIKEKGDDAIENWIDNQLKGTSVTVVLIGTETHTRKWVKRELNKSWVRGNGILGIHIHQIEDKDGTKAAKGKNHFGSIFKMNPDDGKELFRERFNTYDWIDNDGYKNFGKWIEKAAKDTGK